MIAIAAVDKNWGIGNNGKLLFKIRDDIEMFSKVTKEYGVVVMGRKTFESIGKLLPDRINIILSAEGIDYEPKENEKDIEYHCFATKENVLDFIKSNNLYSKTCIIGGEKIYNLFIDYCSKSLITKVEKEFEYVDAYFPNLDYNENWSLLDRSRTKSSIFQNLIYTYNEYMNFKPNQI